MPVRLTRFDGRTSLSKRIKEQLIERRGCKCFIYLEEIDERFLQIDHRVPYEIAGEQEADVSNPDDFILLCGSANRAKSWSCEHCENWKETKDPRTCLSCYWAYSENYSHVAMRQIRRLDLLWSGDGVSQYDKLREDAAAEGVPLPEFVKEALRRRIDDRKPG